MSKYGLFGGNLKDPMQTFEGDKIVQNGDHVYVYTSPDGTHTQNQVAAVKLGPGQVVKLLED